VDLTARFLNPVQPGRDPNLERGLWQPGPITRGPLGGSLRRLEEQQILELVTQYLHGTTIRDLAEAYSINVTTVHDHLRRQGVSLRAYRKLEPDQVHDAVDRYRSGASIYALARQFEVSWNTMQTVLIEAGAISKT
jgi:hypothetical protein